MASGTVAVDILGVDGRRVGCLSVRPLDSWLNYEPEPLLDLRQRPDRDPVLEPVQLLEGAEYTYEIKDVSESGPFILHPEEAFSPDDRNDGMRGRLRPALYTGMLPVTLRNRTIEIGRAAFEVRSRKLDYTRHYRWMMRDIAEIMSEIAMERFSPSEMRFRVDPSRPAELLYEQFAFLKGLMSSEGFDASMRRVLSRPHIDWEEHWELRRPAQGVKPSGRMAVQFVKSGRRLPWPGRQGKTLPYELEVPITDASVDNAANRFVKFVLMHWRDTCSRIGELLKAGKDTAIRRRGCGEVDAAIRLVDQWLSESLFREVGPLRQFPAANQVLQKREGYRDVLRAYIQFEAAAALTWEMPEGDDRYHAGQRDVAALYEYWVYIELVKILARRLGVGFDPAKLIGRDHDSGTLSIGLARGRQQVLDGAVTLHGRRLRVELHYNRTFGSTDGLSWSRAMRPDYSIRIQPDSLAGDDVWLHFDAKYRVDKLQDILGARGKTQSEEEQVASEAAEAESRGSPKRADLLKMHAYRDAIRRSAGAYVIYPGNEDEPRVEYNEILPGLGAFALKPSLTGVAQGAKSITGFINGVFEHVARQTTRHERSRYWLEETYRTVAADEPRVGDHPDFAPFLERPPADTVVLFGYVKSHAHYEWIVGNWLYNMRAGSKRAGSVEAGSQSLSADIIILYGATEPELWFVNKSSPPQVKDQQEMLNSGYPEPKSDRYFCLPLRPDGNEQVRKWLQGALGPDVPRSFKEVHQRVFGDKGIASPYDKRPLAITWLELVQAISP